jgi:hypothetical protein
MSYIIKNKSELHGTCYIELYPGRFYSDSLPWNESSIYFTEDDWELLGTVLRRHFPAYDPYGFQSFSKSDWEPILEDLTAIARRIERGAQIVDIREDISFESESGEEAFIAAEDENLAELKETIDEFVAWANENLEREQWLSILGL